MTDAAVTVIGATSKLGQNLIRRLTADGRRVIPLARNIRALPDEQQAQARYFDLTQPDSLRTALLDAQQVVSCVQAHEGATVVAALPKTIGRVVLMGSTRIFSRYPDPKIELQKAAVDALARSGLPGVVLHPTMIYGGPVDVNVQRIAAYIRKFGLVPLPDGGGMLLQPIHTDDMVSCILAALERDTALGDPIIVAGPEEISYRKLVQAIGQVIGKHPFILPLPILVLQAVAMLTSIVPRLPTIRIDEVRRLGEDKTFPIDGMLTRLGITPIGIQDGLRRTFPTA